MAITLRDSAKNAVLDDGSPATEGSPTLPTHQSGDLLLVFCYYSRNIADEGWSSNTAGWELVTRGQNTAGRDQSIGVFYKFATSSSESAPVLEVYSGGGSDYMSFISCAYTGVDPRNPFEGVETRLQANEGDSPNSPGVLTSSDNTRVLSYVTSTHFLTQPTYTAPTGYTIVEQNPASEYHNNCALADKAVSTAGYEDPGAWSLSGSDADSELGSITLALRDESETTAPPAYFIGMNQEGASGVSSVAIAVPDGTLDGDLLIAVANQINVAGRTTTPPAGWTEVTALDVDTTVGTDGNSEVYYREASGENPQDDTYTWTWSGSEVSGVSILCYRGVNISGGVWDVTPTTAHVNEGIENDTTPQVPAITTNTDGAVLLNIWTGGTTGGGATGVSRTGYQDIKGQNGATLDDAGRLNFGGVMAFLQKYQSTAGAEAAGDITLINANSGADGSTRVIALLPKVEEISASGSAVFTDTDSLTSYNAVEATGSAVFTDTDSLTSYNAVEATGSVVFTDTDSLTSYSAVDAADTVVFTDTDSLTSYNAIQVSDTAFAISSAALLGDGFPQAFDSVTFTDTASISSLQVVAATDGVVFTDTENLTSYRAIDATGSAVFTDTDSLTAYNALQVSDIAFAISSAAILGTGSLAASADAVFTEAASILGVRDAVATEDVLFTDVANGARAIFADSSDSAVFSDSVTLTARGFTSATADALFTDSVTAIGEASIEATDSTVFTDNVVILGVSSASKSGSAVFTETGSLTGVSLTAATGQIVFLDSAEVESIATAIASDTVVFTTSKSIAVATKTPTPFERRSLNLLFRDGTRQTVERDVIEQIPISRKRRT